MGVSANCEGITQTFAEAHIPNKLYFRGRTVGPKITTQNMHNTGSKGAPCRKGKEKRVCCVGPSSHIIRVELWREINHPDEMMPHTLRRSMPMPVPLPAKRQSRPHGTLVTRTQPSCKKNTQTDSQIDNQTDRQTDRQAELT